MYGISTWTIQYQFILQSTVESSSSQTECFSLPIHSESCNMRLCYCVTADYCSHPSPDGRRTAWQRSNLHETARKRPACAPAVGFNSKSFGSATRSRDADADRCAVCRQPVLLSASTPHHLPLSRLLLQPPGRCRRPLSALTARSLPFDPAAARRNSCLTSPHGRALCLRMARRKGDEGEREHVRGGRLCEATEIVIRWRTRS